MTGPKVKILCFAMFALFLEVGARTRPPGSLAFSHLGNQAEISHLNPRLNSFLFRDSRANETQARVKITPREKRRLFSRALAFRSLYRDP